MDKILVLLYHDWGSLRVELCSGFPSLGQQKGHWREVGNPTSCV